MSLRIGLVGATGRVGDVFIDLLEEKKIQFEELRPFASENSKGKFLQCSNRKWEIQTLSDDGFKDLDLVFFSSGDSISKEWAPKAVLAGAYAIDNSAAFRMDDNTALVVPEVNFHHIKNRQTPQIIANPNCSTIQLVIALEALKSLSVFKSIHVATYQAVSGAGKIGNDELLLNTLNSINQTEEKNQIQCFSQNIAFNALPHIGSFDDSGFSSEELKIMKESRKILDINDLQISAFTVRVPIINAHSEAVWVEFADSVNKEDIVECFKKQPGLVYMEHSSEGNYPHTHLASNKDDVYVGRLHQDLYNPKKWIFWIVADNLRKGAALNGLQIAEKLFL